MKTHILFGSVVVGLFLIVGCRDEFDTSEFEPATNSVESSDQRKTERLFDNAIEALNRLEQDSSVESGNRITGRLNEWIKTIHELKDWSPDPMTPQWQKDVQKNLPFITLSANQVQFARQDISLTIDKLIHFLTLQQELIALKRNQEAGATDQKTQGRIAKIEEECGKLNAELEQYQTPDSVKKLLEYLPKVRLILADESAPAYDSWNVESFDAFASSVKRIADEGLKLLVNVPPAEILGMMDSVSSWLHTIAGNFSLDELAFPESDIHYLQESVWLRDASEWAQGTSADDLSRVTSLFDWTMKNIALESPSQNKTRRIAENEPEDCQACRPVWQILLSGQGTAAERAWVFARLAEHQGLDVVLVSVPIPEQPISPAPEPAAPVEENAPVPSDSETPVEENATTSASAEGEEVNAKSEDLSFPAPETENKPEIEVKPETESQTSLPELPDVAPPERLLVAWVAEDNLYFFDPEYGLPIPAPNGITLSADAQDKGLKIVPATLNQILEDESVLNRMSFTDSRNKERKYYLTPDDFKNAEFYLPINPTSLSKRMWILETRLTGEQNMRLTSSPSEVKARLEKFVPGAAVKLWDPPFAVPMFSPVRQSDFNVLLETVVNLTYSSGDKPLRRARIMHLKGMLAPQNEDDDCAVVWYQRSRLTEAKIMSVISSPTNTISAEMFLEAGQFSTYWLGLLSDALDNHEAAEEYFRLIISQEGLENLKCCWTAAAMYNLGRVEEETGQFEKAIDDYQSVDRQDPSYIGSALRAELIKELGGKEK